MDSDTAVMTPTIALIQGYHKTCSDIIGRMKVYTPDPPRTPPPIEPITYKGDLDGKLFLTGPMGVADLECTIYIPPKIGALPVDYKGDLIGFVELLDESEVEEL